MLIKFSPFAFLSPSPHPKEKQSNKQVKSLNSVEVCFPTIPTQFPESVYKFVEISALLLLQYNAIQYNLYLLGGVITTYVTLAMNT